MPSGVYKRKPEYSSRVWETRRKNGTTKAWNKGLTKENDKRIKNISERLKGHVAWNKELTTETDERVRKYGEKLKGKTPFKNHNHSEETKIKISRSETGKKVIIKEETKEKISKSLKLAWKNENSKLGIKETREKRRIAALNRVLSNGKMINVGKNETRLLNEQEKIDNCKIDRNFTCIGYHPDGYCKETNIVYEVYERKHLQPKKVEKDSQRQHNIQNHLHCNFKIIWDK